MITLYGTPRSRALRVSWLLEEIGIDWNFEFINFTKGDNKKESFLALNPSGKFPVLVDGDFVLTESAAINLYLCDKYANKQFLPKGGVNDVARHHQWMSFITTELEQPLWTMGKHKFALPEAVRVPEVLVTAKWEFNKASQLAENMMPETQYLFGENITVADIMLAQTLVWADVFEQEIPPKLKKHMANMMSRPSFNRAIEKGKKAITK
ncbi:glutathione S-transferase family protein [Shewanella sp. 202IG2-18]|uniref:glutathione S-transferase family protein n=1 Tax=Parashewanella hymeniacidonis TaxID=2807618 RepID=UPI0019602330|nr:glutathione S-transferase family protein [Parashewanella hymeniacidonis]MBM7072339.1 glutathione S-transferase family protein [Parashewanella hymeniacidonis]